MAILDIDEILRVHRQRLQSTRWPDIVELLSRRLEQNVSVTVKGTGDEQFAALGKALQERVFPQVQTLRLHWKRLSEEGLMELATAILTGNLPGLKVLNLANCFQRENHDFGIGDRGLIALTTALGAGNSISLKSLQIGDFNKSLHDEIFGIDAAQALAEAFLLGGLPQLEDLRLNGLHSEDGVVAILSALESGTVGILKRLRLEDCEIGIEAAVALASALRSPNFSTLEVLNLQHNVGSGLGDGGVIIISTALRSANMNHLHTLWLHNVSMGERGLMELASLLEEGYLPNLKKLYVAGAEHTPTTTEAFLKAYTGNSSLVVSIYIKRPTNPIVAHELGDSETQGSEDCETEKEELKVFETQLEEVRSRNEKVAVYMKHVGANVTDDADLTPYEHS